MRNLRKCLGIFLAILLIAQTAFIPLITLAEDSAYSGGSSSQPAPAPPAPKTDPPPPKPTDPPAPPPTEAPTPKPTVAPTPPPVSPTDAPLAHTDDPLLNPAPVGVPTPEPVDITEIPRYLVDFYSYDGTRIASQYVEEGQAAVQPRPPMREGYAFTGWQPSINNVTKDMSTTATYEKLQIYSVIIHYYFEESGEPAARAREEFYMAGEAVSKTYEPVSITGYESKTPSFSIQTNAMDRDYTFDFVYVAGSDTTYTVEHWFEQLNGSYTSDPALTRQLTGGTGSLVKAEPLPTDQITGFTVNFVGEGRVAADGSTVLQVKYQRQRFVLTFDTDAGGTYTQPLVLKYDEPIILPNDPSRAGYTFEYWVLMPTEETVIPTVMPASDLLLAARWIPEMVSYQLIYWLEKTNIDGDPGTDPDNYAFNKQEERQVLAGTALSLQAKDVGTVSYAIFSHADQDVVIKGDGSTIVNVYFKRIVYTVTFSLNTNDPAVAMVLNGQSYTIRNPYVINVKSQQDIGAIWPSLKNAVFSPGFNGWKAPFSTSNWVTHRFVFTDDMIPPSGTSYTVSAIWNTKVVTARVNYWFEALPGSGGKTYTYNGVTYALSAYDSQDIALLQNSTVSPKAIVGMAAGQNPASLQFRAGGAFIGDYSTTSKSDYAYEYNFFYLRLRNTLSFNTFGAVAPPASSVIPFGMPLAGYDPGWDSNKKHTDATGVTYEFAGWYQDAAYLTPFHFTDTMPNRNMTAFAKWVPQTFTVIFMDDGTELTRRTVDGGSLLEPYTPTRTGYVFMGWAKDPEGAQWFSYAEKIYRDTVLYAIWNAGYTNYTVRYLQDGPGGAPMIGYPEKVVRSVEVGSTITETAAAIPSYFPDSISKSLTLQADAAENVIEFYYVPATEITYIVRYVDAATWLQIPSVPDKQGMASSSRIVENYLAIAGYTPRSYQISAWLSSDVSQNVLEFVYDANDPEQYTVQHMIQIGVRNDGSPIYRQYGEMEFKTGPVGSMTHADPLDLGSKYVFVGGNEPQLIRPDSEIHMILYYDALCTVTFATEDGGFLTGITFYDGIPCGAFFSTITVPAPIANDGYIFIGWDRPFPERIEQDWLFIARFEPIHELTITAGSATKVYDGTPLVNETYTYNQSALFDGHTLEIYTSGSITHVGRTGNVLTTPVIYDQSGNNVMDMYRITLVDGELEVTPASITLVITAASDAKQYDGTPLFNPNCFSDPDALIPGNVLQATAIGSITEPGSAPNTVGSWKVVDEQGEDVSENYLVHTVDGLLTITPREDELIITAASDAKQYDGTPLTNATFAHDPALLAEGHALTAVVEGSITDVGTAENHVVFWQITDQAGADVSAHYRVAAVNGLLTVLPVRMPITVIAASDQKFYDGTPLANSNYTYDPASLVPGHSVIAQVQGSITDVGEAVNRVVSLRVVDRSGRDATRNYTLLTQDGLLTVLPPQTVLVITAASDSKVYDGKLLTNPNYTVGSGRLFEGHALLVVVSGSIINVGSAENVVKAWQIIDASGNDVSANYRVETMDGLLTIMPREARLLVRADSAVKFYDGTPLVDPIYTYDALLLLEGDALTAVVDGSITDAGSVDNVVASYTITGADGMDVTDNYTVMVVDGKLTVLPREIPLVITAASAEKVYDGMPLTNPGYTFDASLFINGHTLTAIVMGSITNVGTTSNIVTEWRITDHEGRDVTFDYTVWTIPGTLTVLPGDGSEVPEPPTTDSGELIPEARQDGRPSGGTPYNVGHNMQ